MPWSLVKYRVLGLTLNYGFSRLGMGWTIGISNEFPGDDDVAGLVHILRTISLMKSVVTRPKN